MTRPSVLAVLLAAGLSATFAVAQQPTKQPPQFRPFGGVTPEQFYQSSVARSADQLAGELAATKTAAAGLMPQSRTAVSTRADQAAAAARDVARQARRSPDRAALDREYQSVRTAVKELESTVAQTQAGPALAGALSRVGYARRQLAATVAGGDRNPDRVKGVAAELAEGLDHQAEELRTVAAEKLGPMLNQTADPAILRFVRTARRMHRNLDDSGDLNQARKDYAAVTERWGEVVNALRQVNKLPPAVRVQVGRVDGLYRKLGDAVAQPPLQGILAFGSLPAATPPNPMAGGEWVWVAGQGWLWKPALPRSW
jgi:hypothetical protein